MGAVELVVGVTVSFVDGSREVVAGAELETDGEIVLFTVVVIVVVTGTDDELVVGSNVVEVSSAPFDVVAKINQ